MHDLVVSLIAEPGGLDAALPDNLRNAWGGDDVLWLSQGEAAEFGLHTMPDNFWDVWADLQTARVDLVMQPREGRRKMLLLADMDSTMIQQECIDELADVAGFGDQVKEITAKAMNGELDFEEAIDARVALLKGLPTDVIGQVLAERITYTPGGTTLLATMKAAGAYTALVSGGFTAFTGPVATYLGFDEHRANVLLEENGALTGAVQKPVLGQQAKMDAVDELTAQRGITDDQCLAVGDGANDLGMLGLAGLGVAMHAKPSVAEACAVRVNFGDLTALLYLQGYAKSEFVIPGA
ncbi:MAG: phosphoserine phosphatase SerB [Pseudomonadota bacterium]